MAITIRGGVSINYVFKPISISGLQLWLDASDSSTLYQDSAGTTLATADGDPIGYWKDKSGNGRHATQTDGTKKPLRKDSQLNSKIGIRYDGVNDLLSIASSGLTSQPYSYYLVAKWLNFSVHNTMIGGNGFDPGNVGGNFDIYSGNLNFYAGTFGMLQFKPASTNAFAARCEFNGASSKYQENNGTIYTGDPGTRTPSTLELGWNTASYGNVMQFEICVFNRLLSANEILSMFNYFNSKWSVY